jgi:PAS domain S-box-containing protein
MRRMSHDKTPSSTAVAADWPGKGRRAETCPDVPHEAGLPDLQASLSAGGAAAWHTNLQTRERWWSAEMFRIHGLAGSDAVPADYMDLVYAADRPLVAAAFHDSVETGSHRIQYRVGWPDGSLHWLEGIGQTTRDAAGRPLVVRGVCWQIDQRKREEADLRFLAQASAEFAQSSDYEETLRRVARLAVPHFADWCAVDMLEGRSALKRVAVAHVDPAKVALAEDLHRRYPPDPNAAVGAWHVLKTARAELVAEIPDALLVQAARDDEHLRLARSLGLRSYMGVPMVGADGVLGVITFVSSDSGRVYAQRDLELATDLVSRAAVAVQNAALIRTLRRSEARQGFLLALTDVLRAGGATQEVLTAVSELLGRHFGVNRVGYGHVDELQDRIDYDVCWTDGSVAPLLGQFPASAFGPQVIARLRAGQTIAIANVREHPLTSEEATLRTSHEVETRAILVVPLFKAGQLRTIVYLNQGPEREWTADEVSLMEDVAERTRELIERGRTEQALRESENRWRGLFERMTEGFFVGEAVRDDAGRMVDFRFLQINPAFEKLTGIAPSLALGRTVTEVIPGFERDIIDLYARVVDTGEPAEFEVQVAALNERWYEARARAVGSDQFSVLFLEVTQRKQIQQDLARSAQRYRTLFESIDEGFCILEVLCDASGRPRDYRFVEVNPAFERQAGLSNAVGRTIRELVPAIEDSYIETYGRVALTGETIRFESRADALDRWFDAFAFRVGEPAQRRVALLFTDITERKLAQDALLERESQLREAQSLAGIGSWYWDVATDVTVASAELLRIYGMGEHESLPPFAQQRGSLYVAEDWERLNAMVHAAVVHGTPYSIDLRAFRAGKPIWVIARGAPVRGDDGRVIALRGTVQDITERKQIEEALREADTRKDEFLATLAHELRNPLAPLRNGLTILRMGDGTGPAAVRARELMERQLAHLVRLVDDLLDVSRVSQGKVTMKKSITSLQSLVELALETAKPLVDSAGHTLTVDLPHEPVLMHVDPTRMAQVLSNLLNNAAKYTPQGGRIALKAAIALPGHLQVTVQDNGVGIPADMLDKVFDLFTQVGGAVERSQGGLGIGLSLARRLVELHGGQVRASSAGAGHGSTFTLDLPLLEVPVAPAEFAPAARVEPAGVGRRVLVVDDNVDAAETLAMLLELDGHQVQVVHTGAAALDAVSAGAPEIVFLDIGLPDLNGYAVATRIRSAPSLQHTLLDALTGWGSERDRSEARQAGFDVHLTKPVTPEDLAAVLARRAPRQIESRAVPDKG